MMALFAGTVLTVLYVAILITINGTSMTPSAKADFAFAMTHSAGGK